MSSRSRDCWAADRTFSRLPHVALLLARSATPLFVAASVLVFAAAAPVTPRDASAPCRVASCWFCCAMACFAMSEPAELALLIAAPYAAAVAAGFPFREFAYWV